MSAQTPLIKLGRPKWVRRITPLPIKGEDRAIWVELIVQDKTAQKTGVRAKHRTKLAFPPCRGGPARRGRTETQQGTLKKTRSQESVPICREASWGPFQNITPGTNPLNQVRIKAKVEKHIPRRQEAVGRAGANRRPWLNHSFPMFSRAMWPLDDNPSLGVESRGQDESAVCPRVPSPG